MFLKGSHQGIWPFRVKGAVCASPMPISPLKIRKREKK